MHIAGIDIPYSNISTAASVFGFSPQSTGSSASGAQSIHLSSLRERCRERRVLAVDDERFIHDVIRVALTPIECRLDSVANGEAALHAITEHEYDLILMDVWMPGMDGVATARQIRSDYSEYANTPILAMTVDLQPSRISQYRAAGMNSFLAKPLNMAKILRALDTWMPKQAAPDSVTDQRAVTTEIANIRERFVRSLNSELAQLNGMNLDSPQAHATIHATAHRLAGLAGTIGMPELGEQASRINLCYTGGQRPELRDVAEFLQAICTVIERANRLEC